MTATQQTTQPEDAPLSTVPSLFTRDAAMRHRLIPFAAMAIAATLAGCAATGSVAPTGQDTFMVSKQAATGFAGLSDLKAEALREAGQHCASRGSSMQMISQSENQGPYLLGHYPRVEVYFRCQKG